MSTADLLAHRLVLVTGKGGVGKSTCALALAVAGCRQGKRVLLCELSARAVSVDFLGGPVPKHQARQPAPTHYPTLWTAHLDARLALQDYLIELLHTPRLVKIATENHILARLWQAAPSVNEMALLSTIYQLERARDGEGRTDGKRDSKADNRSDAKRDSMGEGSGVERPRYDLIVVDMPATGHALALLGVPRGAAGIFRVGAIAERVRAVDELLHDQARTAVCIVTLPEELSINESVQMTERLRGLGMEPSHIVVNRVLPDLLEKDERELFERISQVVEAGPGRTLLDAAHGSEERRRVQVRRVQHLRERVRTEFIEVKHLARRGMDLVRAIADAIGH